MGITELNNGRGKIYNKLMPIPRPLHPPLLPSPTSPPIPPTYVPLRRLHNIAPAVRCSAIVLAASPDPSRAAPPLSLFLSPAPALGICELCLLLLQLTCLRFGFHGQGCHCTLQFLDARLPVSLQLFPRRLELTYDLRKANILFSRLL